MKIIIGTLLIICFLTGCRTISSINTEATPQHSAAAEANVKLAIAFLKLTYVKEAKQKLLLAQQYDPLNPAVWYGMGYFNETIGEMTEARKNYQKAILLAPNNGATHNNYGAFLCRIGQYKESIQQFLLATKDPNYLDTASAYENAGFCALKIPDKILAEIYFQKAQKQDPNKLINRNS